MKNPTKTPKIKIKRVASGYNLTPQSQVSNLKVGANGKNHPDTSKSDEEIIESVLAKESEDAEIPINDVRLYLEKAIALTREDCEKKHIHSNNCEGCQTMLRVFGTYDYLIQKGQKAGREACEKESQEKMVDLDLNYANPKKKIVGKALHDSVTRETYDYLIQKGQKAERERILEIIDKNFPIRSKYSGYKNKVKELKKEIEK